MQKLLSMLFLMAAISISNSTINAQSANFYWAEQEGGTNRDFGFDIAMDSSGNSVITGAFSGEASFGDTTLVSSGSFDIFFSKYDGDGNFLWVAQAGGMDEDRGHGVETDDSGNCIVTGRFSGITTFGDTTLTSAGSRDIFIAKYDGDGNFLWVEQSGGTDSDDVLGIAMDGTGNIIVTGHFSGTATFGDSILTSVGMEDIFIAKYDSDGNLLWVERAGGASFDEGIAVATDGSDNIMVTGWFSSTATFGSTTLTSTGIEDIFIAKYDSDGNFLWVEQSGGTSSDIGSSIATDGSGNSIVTGRFEGTAAFGDTILTSAGFPDIFVAKYDSDGSFLWVEQAGGTGFDVGSDIATDTLGNSIVAGSFDGVAIFGDTTLTSAGSLDIFMAKYDGDGNFLWVEQAGGTQFDAGVAIIRDGSDNSLVTGWFSGRAIFGNTTLNSAGLEDIFIAKLGASVTGIEEKFAFPRSFNLSQSYPNPFNPSTTIEFSLPQSGFVTLKVYNMLGEEVTTLVNGDLNMGRYTTHWNASGFASGVYLYRLQAGDYVETKKMILMK